MDSICFIRVCIFFIGTISFLFISKNSLFEFEKHGFFRFFVFEFSLILVLENIPFWIIKPFSPVQVISWIFLLISIYLLFHSFYSLKKFGGNKEREKDTGNFNFENTVHLVNEGVYKYIRHPMYSSLLFLCLGTFLKNISFYPVLLTLLIILFLILTAMTEEKENIKFFGLPYSEYIKETKMFIPFIF